MPRSIAMLLTMATLSVGTLAHATVPAGPDVSSEDSQQEAAPIVRAYADQNGNDNNSQMAQRNQAGRTAASDRQITSSHPIPGVIVRAEADSALQTVSADTKGTELRLTHGVVNVSVHHPERDVRILVDLPGGQTALLKDGMYTFNAETNIVRVLKGEADAYPGAAENGIKVKEDHQFAFGANGNRSVESARGDLMADYLPTNDRNGDPGAAPRSGYAYGDGFYGGYPYAYGYPYGYYPYGYGLGLGFGYYGGFRGGYGGFRGGYGGFHGGGFRGR